MSQEDWQTSSSGKERSERRGACSSLNVGWRTANDFFCLPGSTRQNIFDGTATNNICMRAGKYF